MTLEQARENIGRIVVYKKQWHNGKMEQGIITSVNDKYAFVRYDYQMQDSSGQATDPKDLELLNKGELNEHS
jgi:hypothetical protein